MFARNARSIAVVLVPLLAACSQMTQSEIKALETRDLLLPYDEAYRAAANGLMSLGFTIDHSDKVSGIVSGKRNDPRTGVKITNAIFFGVIGLAATSGRNEAVSFMVSPLDDRESRLRMKVVVNGKPIADRKLMTEIWQRIEREGMLDSGPSERGKPAAQVVAKETRLD